MLDVQLGGLRGVMRGMVQMALRGVRVVRRGFMVVSFVMCCGFAMVPSRMVIVGNRYRIGVGGDLIIAIDGKPVDGQDALRNALNQKRPGEAMVLTIFRGNRTVKVTITLGSAAEAL